MLVDLIKASWKPLILIALVSLTMTTFFHIQNTLITEMTINGIQIKTFNIQTYLQNINNSWETNALNFEEIIPNRTWDNNWSWGNIGNNLAFLFDWLYFPINFILWLLRWFSWLLKILLAIIGWNIGTDANGNYYSQLASILSWVTQNLMIPYI